METKTKPAKRVPESRLNWLKDFERETKRARCSHKLEDFSEYIDFKLIYDFSFSDGKFIDVSDSVAVEYFLGCVDIDQVKRDFSRNAIVLQSPECDRLYFGSPTVSKKRMKEETGSVHDFDRFITTLEKKVFHSDLQNLDERSRQTLAMVLRIINQGVSAVAMRMFNGLLQVTRGNLDITSFGTSYLMRPDSDDHKGSTQIDVIFRDGVANPAGNTGVDIQLSRREYLTVQAFDPEAMLDPDPRAAEKWSMLTLVSRRREKWTLNFSVSQITSNAFKPTQRSKTLSGTTTKTKLRRDAAAPVVRSKTTRAGLLGLFSRSKAASKDLSIDPSSRLSPHTSSRKSRADPAPLTLDPPQPEVKSTSPAPSVSPGLGGTFRPSDLPDSARGNRKRLSRGSSRRNAATRSKSLTRMPKSGDNTVFF